MSKIIVIRQATSNQEIVEINKMRRILPSANPPIDKDLNTINKTSETSNVFDFIIKYGNNMIGTTRISKINDNSAEIDGFVLKKEFFNDNIGLNFISHLEWFVIGLKLKTIYAKIDKRYRKLYYKKDYISLDDDSLKTNNNLIRLVKDL